MLARAATLAADAIVFDLEDSVPLTEKEIARVLVSETLANWPTGSPAAYIRINPPRFGMLRQDTTVIASAPQAGIVVPKVDRPVELAAVFAAAGRDRDVIVNLETPRAILRAEAFADTSGVGGIFLGGEDFTNAIGARRTVEGTELGWARFAVLLAARAAGIAAYDTICPEFRDLAIVEQDARYAAELGYDGKFAIHPAQLSAIHSAFTPSGADVERATRIIAAFDQAQAGGIGAVAVDGQMVDPPVAERARAVLRRARRSVD